MGGNHRRPPEASHEPKRPIGVLEVLGADTFFYRISDLQEGPEPK